MNTQIALLVEEAVRKRLQTQIAFTALDISNALKSANFPVRHSDVAAVVRDVYGSGAMDAYDYRRTLIEVNTDGGQKQTQAFLYLPQPARERDYQARTQDALPPVPADLARDLSDGALADAGGALPRPPRSALRSRRGRTRRDGALFIPLTLVRQMGWTFGTGAISLRVWDGERVRVCRHTVRLGDLHLGTVTWDVQGSTLHIISL